MLQRAAAQMSSPFDLLRVTSTEARVVLVVLALLSLLTWFLIIYKWWQLRRLEDQHKRFFWELERSQALQEAYHAVMKLPPSPFSRVFREGIAFYADLRPGGLKRPEGSQPEPLTSTQIGALRAVVGKEIAWERDSVARHVPWLATISSVSPFLGLLGTVLGIMNSFLGIAITGSGNIAAVAPGVAEALVTTAAGLGIAIPAVIAYNYFANRISRLEGDLEGLSDEMLGWMAREGMV
jgi:biopolymer transport protein TolQ